MTVSAKSIRRLAVRRQHLSGKLPGKANRDSILSVVHDLTFVQWDPISVVAPSHILSLWNRVGNFRLSDLETLLWKEKKLFEHWVNFTLTLVLTEDYPLYYSMMRLYPESMGKSWRFRKPEVSKFLAEHKELGDSVLKQLKKGPLLPSQFREYAPAKGIDAWNSSSDVSDMLFHLHMMGKVMVVGHEGKKNVWGLSEQFLPSWVKKSKFSLEEIDRVAAERAIRSLGTATPPEINIYFPRGRYTDLKKALENLEREGKIARVKVNEFRGRDDRYVHSSDIKLLESMESVDFPPRISLLPPFDNLVNGRHTRTVFGFDYSHEMFLPQNKRKFGYYVLPILWEDKIIGRVDPLLDKSTEKLMVKSVHAEPGAPTDNEVATKIAEKLNNLAEFLGAKEVVYSERVPPDWRRAFN
jgi:uncharacterized protein